ncbi:putative sodium-coupled neutral amino acid transporter 10 isoform X2 [Pomacea canaliculata]|nr:putative sodium-coupled neutral amino acid transporter 10 isoform X2 [Pomacea canaliculata]
MKLFPSTFGANVMKLGFVLSIAITFPVIIFPCRASIYTLVFQKKMKHGDDVIGNYIPEQIFKAITIGIVLVSTITGILIPNVEFILGLNGAITGTLICYIFPALFFLHVMSSKAEGKTIAQIVLALGLVFLLVSTFTTLKTPDSSQVQQSAGIPDHLSHHLAGNPEIDSNWHKDQLDSVKKDGAKADIEKRVEPPNPQEDLAKKAIGNNIVAEEKGPKPLDQHDTDDVNRAKQFPAEGAQDQAAKEGRGGDKADLERHDDKRRQQELLAALEAQRAEQERLLIEQKAVLQELKDHKKEHEIDGPEKQIQQVANDQKPGQAFPVDQKVDQNIIPQQPNDVQAKPMPHQDHQQQEQPVVIANEVAPQQQKQPLQDVGDPQNLQSQQELQVDKLPGPVQNVPEQVKDQIQQQQNLVKQPQIPDQQPQAQAQEVPQQEQVLPGAKSGQADLAQQPGIAVQQDQVPIIPENVKIDAVRSKREVVGNVMPVVSPVEKHISTKGEVEKTGARKDLVVPMKSSSVDDQGDKEEMRRRLKEAGYEDAVADHVPDLDMSKVVQSIVNQGIVIRSLKDHRD